MSTSIDLETVTAVAEPICAAHGVELVLVQAVAERGGVVLRITLDREGSERGPGYGVSLADCQAVSRDLGPALEVHEVASGNYRLEVSSPGLDRPLVRERDYQRFLGREVRLEARAPVEGADGAPSRRKFRGRLAMVTGEDAAVVHLEVDGRPYAIPLADVSKANLVPELP